MQSITTKYLGPTTHRGARIKATAEVGSLIVPYDGGLSSEDNHAQAAICFCKEWGWTGTLASGGHNWGYHFVFIKEYNTYTV